MSVHYCGLCDDNRHDCDYSDGYADCWKAGKPVYTWTDGIEVLHFYCREHRALMVGAA